MADLGRYSSTNPHLTRTKSAALTARETRTVKLRGAASQFQQSQDKEVLLVGPAGTGKTRGILEVFHDRLLRYAGSRAMVVRKYRSSLTESALVTYETQVLGIGHPIVGRTRRENRHAYHYPNGSTLVVEGCDNPERLFSSEYDGIYVQEAIELELGEWESLGRALRYGRWPFQQLAADTNPSYPGHWLRKRLDSGKTRELKSRIRDNPAFWDLKRNRPTPRGKQYLATLSGMTGVRRKRLLKGIWAAAEEQWFDQWNEKKHVQAVAEYDPALPARLAVDVGVYTGAVMLQVLFPLRPGWPPIVSVFGEYLAEGMSVRKNARSILAEQRARGVRGFEHRVCDPAANARMASGMAVQAEYASEGLGLEPWPLMAVNDGLVMIASLLEQTAPDGLPCLRIHPRCTKLIEAFASYARAKRGSQWTDKPEDPQHPHEDVMDALRGAICHAFPEGLGPEPEFHWIPSQHAF